MGNLCTVVNTVRETITALCMRFHSGEIQPQHKILLNILLIASN